MTVRRYPRKSTTRTPRTWTIGTGHTHNMVHQPDKVARFRAMSPDQLMRYCDRLRARR